MQPSNNKFLNGCSLLCLGGKCGENITGLQTCCWRFLGQPSVWSTNTGWLAGLAPRYAAASRNLRRLCSPARRKEGYWLLRSCLKRKSQTQLNYNYCLYGSLKKTSVNSADRILAGAFVWSSEADLYKITDLVTAGIEGSRSCQNHLAKDEEMSPRGISFPGAVRSSHLDTASTWPSCRPTPPLPHAARAQLLLQPELSCPGNKGCTRSGPLNASAPCAL